MHQDRRYSDSSSPLLLPSLCQLRSRRWNLKSQMTDSPCEWWECPAFFMHQIAIQIHHPVSSCKANGPAAFLSFPWTICFLNLLYEQLNQGPGKKGVLALRGIRRSLFFLATVHSKGLPCLLYFNTGVSSCVLILHQEISGLCLQICLFWSLACL
jgi:hypothetical protein